MQDLYQIVDDQDNLIGAKPRNEIDLKMTTTAYQAFGLQTQKARYLSPNDY